VRRRRKFPVGEPVRGAGALAGRIASPRRAPLRGLEVLLTGAGGNYRTSTSQSGSYMFVNLPPGEYTLHAGDQSQPVEIAPDSSPEQPHTLDLTNVRRSLDLRTAPVWEVQDTLGVPSETVRRIGGELGRIHNLTALVKAAGVDRETAAAWREEVQLKWQREPKARKPKARRRPRYDDAGS